MDAAATLKQVEMENAVYSATERNGDDGQHQCWGTIRSGLTAGMLAPITLK